MVFGQPTDLSTLLPAVAAQIAAGTSIPAERVLVTLENDAHLTEWDAISDVLVTVAPLKFPIEQGILVGGGVTDAIGQIEICYFNRYEADYTHVDIDGLTDQTNGILANWRLIMKSLQLFVPVDGAGNGLVSEPMKLLMWAIPKRKRSPKGRTVPWLRIVSVWQMEFVQNLS